MHGGSGVDIPNDHTFVILEHKLRLDFTANDLTEDGILVLVLGWGDSGLAHWGDQKESGAPNLPQSFISSAHLFGNVLSGSSFY